MEKLKVIENLIVFLKSTMVINVEINPEKISKSWYPFLTDYSEEVLTKAFTKIILTGTYFPPISMIVKECEILTGIEQYINSNEAWQEVVENISYGHKEGFSNKFIQIAVDKIGGRGKIKNSKENSLKDLFSHQYELEIKKYEDNNLLKKAEKISGQILKSMGSDLHKSKKIESEGVETISLGKKK